LRNSQPLLAIYQPLKLLLGEAWSEDSRCPGAAKHPGQGVNNDFPLERLLPDGYRRGCSTKLKTE
jgi:hypothetical protein